MNAITVTLDQFKKVAKTLPKGESWEPQVYDLICDLIATKQSNMSKLSKLVPCSRPALIKRVKRYLEQKGNVEKKESVTPQRENRVTPPKVTNSPPKQKGLVIPVQPQIKLIALRTSYYLFTGIEHRGTAEQCREHLLLFLNTGKVMTQRDYR